MDKLIEIIVKDDVKEFQKYAESNSDLFNYCLGRFPLLSVCYLFNSKKILLAYEQSMLTEKYLPLDEPKEVYEKFRVTARRALSLYVYQTRVVTPIEMLAILGDVERIKRLYGEIDGQSEQGKTLTKIFYLVHNKTLSENEGILPLPQIGLKAKQKLYIRIAIVLACVMMVATSAMWGLTQVLFSKNGTVDSPIIIKTEKQLLSCLQGGNYYYELGADISLKNTVNIGSFTGKLDGKGHTVTFKGNADSPLIKTLGGKISNINIFISDIVGNVTESRGIFINTNDGILENINYTASGSFNEITDSKTLYVGGMAYKNNGTISNCVVNANLNFVGKGSGSTALAGIAVLNSGVISNCVLSETSVLKTDTVDVSGIVMENAGGGKIIDCINFAKIEQTTSNENWHPNVGGVVLNNNGTVENCINRGKLTANSTSTVKGLYVFVGGIVCNNKKDVVNCSNYGELYGKGAQSIIFVGGIVCSNQKKTEKCYNEGNLYADGHYVVNTGGIVGQNADTATVTLCISYGVSNMNTNEEQNIFLFAGGIVGYNAGVVRESYSGMTYVTENKEGLRIGGIVGGSFTIDNIYKNYYVKGGNIEFGIGAELTQFDSIFVGKGSSIGTVVLDSIELLKASEGYWL